MAQQNRWRRAGLAAGLVLSLATFSAHAAEKVKLGVIAGPEEEIAEVAKKVALTKGVDVQLVTFSDYVQPNAALDAGDLDANAFQHQPYLDSQTATRGYHLVSIAYTIVEPMGLYSKKIKAAADIPNGAKIGIPNDPSNGGRALNLLAANGVIKIKDGKGLAPSVLDIVDNPKKIKFVEIDAAQLPRSLDDLDAAVVNTNYALEGGLDPRKGVLMQEPLKNNIYGNILVVRTKDKDKPALKALAASYQSPEVAAFLESRFHGAILPAW